MKATTDTTQILNVSSFCEMKRSQAEFVITRYNESLDWIKGIEHLSTIYNKGEPIFIDKANIEQRSNYGLGIETMLRHIISRYDTLSDITMFCQGNIADRTDQPLYPLPWYFNDMGNGVKGYLTDAYDAPKSRYNMRDLVVPAMHNRNLDEFRKFIGIPYKLMREKCLTS